MALCVVAFAGCGAEISLAKVSGAEKSSFYRAIALYQGTTKRPLVLDLDKGVLCLDGDMPDQDISLAERLQQGGVFVVRWEGSAMSMSQIKKADFSRGEFASERAWSQAFTVSVCPVLFELFASIY